MSAELLGPGQNIANGFLPKGEKPPLIPPSVDLRQHLDPSVFLANLTQPQIPQARISQAQTLKTPEVRVERRGRKAIPVDITKFKKLAKNHLGVVEVSRRMGIPRQRLYRIAGREQISIARRNKKFSEPNTDDVRRLAETETSKSAIAKKLNTSWYLVDECMKTHTIKLKYPHRGRPELPLEKGEIEKAVIKHTPTQAAVQLGVSLSTLNNHVKRKRVHYFIRSKGGRRKLQPTVSA